jgi:hypothetical protein
LLQIQRDDPNNWERRVTMLELWGGTVEVTNLPLWLHTAFAIPILAGRGEIVEDRQPKKTDPVDVVTSKAPSVRVKELRDWHEERLKLSSATAQLLRDHVHAALADFIDWDEVGLAKSSTVSKKSGLFKAGQISFQNQATQRSDAQISLLIPANWNDEAERIRTTLALEGLLEAKDHGDWSYPDGLQKLGCLLECLRQWAAILVTECKAADVASDGVDIGVLSFELRATLQAAMNSDQPMTSNQEVLKAAFGEIPDRAPDFLTDELSALVLAIRQQDGELLSNINSRYTATKGGDPGGFLDSARLLPLAASLRRRRFLPTETSSAAIEKRSSLGPVRSLARQVTENWTSALLREANARAHLKSQITEFLGERTSSDAIIQSVQRLTDGAANIGVSGAQSMLPVKSRFEQIAYADLLALLRAADPEKLDTRELSSGAGSSGRVVSELIKSSADLLRRTLAEAQGRLADEGADPDEKARVIQAITDDLDEIGTQLERYHDGKLN